MGGRASERVSEWVDGRVGERISNVISYLFPSYTCVRSRVASYDMRL